MRILSVMHPGKIMGVFFIICKIFHNNDNSDNIQEINQQSNSIENINHNHKDAPGTAVLSPLAVIREVCPIHLNAIQVQTHLCPQHVTYQNIKGD